ncbi:MULTISPECIES: energy transducer TonB family protein [Rhizobium]|uniref:energy transducer TonB family protein n=1 Tax=Rhizobium TaxID=379 RepID=UPI0007EB1182|nr:MULTISPECIES: energy transducer TonB [Rhizobium]ANK92856.1 TonB family transporter protein [Rhizobium sp. N6212]ANK98903.1 TonB family transporter protein [Rhizobium sp. N621]ANL05031.1 TonB family transporter protein [Rhizobium esperanzae]ANL11088.1 TonB family transporter protein [Rhizobium sp. N1341]ANL23141.1 TonB family transporter protein [Rhizobium sp. N113]
MAISAKSRSGHVLIGEESADRSLNDNMPGMHPGHELPELRNAQRQAAGETVIHYTRFAQISSFPDHPEAEPAAPASAPPMNAAVEKQEDEQKPVRRRVALTCVGSLIFHVALAAALLIAFQKVPEKAVEEAGEAVSVVMFGNSDVDQTAAGETEVTVQEEIIPEAVEPDTIQPTETASLQPEAVQPTEVSPVETQDSGQQVPAPEVTRVSPGAVAAVEPEVLVSEVPAETAVAQPMSTVVPEQKLDEIPAEVQPSEVLPVAAVEPEQLKPVETAEVQPEPEGAQEIVTPKPKPKMAVQEKPKQVEKKRSPKKISGSQGEAQQDSLRGVTEGNPAAQSDRNSRGVSNNGGVGSAASANYDGKVRSRIRRAIRTPRGVEGTVVVSFSVNGSGGLTSVRVMNGSGVAEIDQLAVNAIRRAAPFGPTPDGNGRIFNSFSIEVQ